MKSLCAIALCVLAGCASAQAAVRPGESAAVHAHTLAMRVVDAPVTPDQPETLRCHGTRKITNGDGHVTDCPGCVDCLNKTSLIETVDEPLIQPAVFERVTKVTKVAKLQCADGSCAAPTATTEACECTQATGSCSCGTKATASGSCSSGSCGMSSVKATGPVRRVAKGIRERRPVRRLFGRLFGRR